MAISSDIVAAHGGRMWLESAKPGTTEFRFWLPVASAGAADQVEDGENGRPEIAVVDDQETVRTGARRDAAACTAMPWTFSISAEAFLNAGAGGEVGCVIADVRMPVMDGIELVREIQKRKLDVPVVLISGHADVPMAV